MPDPHKDLADIVEPRIASIAATGDGWALIGGAVVFGAVLVAAAFWYWRRNAPMRALRRVRRLPDPQGAADALAALLPHFKIQPEPAWLDDLARLRFGPPQEDAPTVLERLCQQAETLLQGKG
ncbi:MAG: DUF4381 family protein [Betaproteobacteria bacterium]|nr:DUF4381 family protein [Betaproteobacteria bacterium]